MLSTQARVGAERLTNAIAVAGVALAPLERKG